MSCCKLRLYGKVLQTENIVKAIEEVKKFSESEFPIEKILREVKLRLRKRIPVGKGNSLTVINYFDQIAQQAVKRVISPIIRLKQNKFSAKISACKVANYVKNFDVHSVEVNIKSCFDSIKLDIALDMLRELGITDGKLLSTIKHLMFSKNYQGVGLVQGTILGNLLCECILHKLDAFMEKNFSKRKIKYVRFADEIFIACRNSEEAEYVNEKVKNFIEKVLELKVNEDTTKLKTNGFEYLGYKFFKTKSGVKIRMKDEKKYLNELRRFNFRSPKNFYDFLKWFRKKIFYFDICNDLNNFLKKVLTRLYIRSKKNSSVLQKKSNSVYSMNDGRKKVGIDVYEWRKKRYANKIEKYRKQLDK